MPVISGRTRDQLAVAIGQNLGAIYVSSASSIGNVGGTTLIDSTLSEAIAGADNVLNGKWVKLTSGGNAGDIRRVNDYAGLTTTITLRSAATGQIANAATYELWDEKYPPQMIHEYINSAILDVVGRYFDPEEDISLHGDGVTARFDIPTEFAILNRVEHRHKFSGADLHGAEVLFDETTNANVTQSLDTEDKKEGSSSLKLVYAAGAGANTLITDNIASINMSKYTHLEMWIKSSVATAAADLHILLDNTAAAVSPLETLAIPALTAGVWTYVRIALAVPQDDTAIISVGFRYTVDIGAATIWLDHIKVVNNNSMLWTALYKHQWRVDKEARDLILTPQGVNEVGYRLIRLVGGDIPALLTTDAGVNEVDDAYVIARVTAMALAVAGDKNLMGLWEVRAERARLRTPLIINGRAVI